MVQQSPAGQADGAAVVARRFGCGAYALELDIRILGESW